MLLDGLLFKILDMGIEDPTTVLCIPTSKAHVLMEYYHSSIMGSHTGITKCFQTISKRFYCPNLAEQLRATSLAVTFASFSRKAGNLTDLYTKGLISMSLL